MRNILLTIITFLLAVWNVPGVVSLNPVSIVAFSICISASMTHLHNTLKH